MELENFKKHLEVWVSMVFMGLILQPLSTANSTLPEPIMNEETIKILQESKNATELKQAAITLAKSDLGSDHQALGKFLGDADFLGRLDSTEDYQGTYIGLRLARVFKTLMDKRTLVQDKTSIDKVLIVLTSQSTYHNNILRVQILIHALAAVKPSPPPAINFWTKYSEPNGPVVFDVIQALCENQSEPAMSLLHKRLQSESQDKYERYAWMQQVYLTKRNDAPLLNVFEKLITSSLPTEFKLTALEATFDYKPEIWYVGCNPVRPPPRVESTPDSKQIQKRIAQYSIDNLELSAKQHNSVVKSMLSMGIKIEKSKR
jgi:hypothetical protein